MKSVGPLFCNAVNRRAGFAPRRLADDFEHAIKALYLAFGFTLMLNKGRPEFFRLRGLGHLRQCLQDLVFSEINVLQTALDDASQKKIAKLRDAKPENFASEYDSMQVSAHKDAVSLFERYANGGEDPKLKDWAGKTLPALKHHLEMAQALDKNRK